MLKGCDLDTPLTPALITALMNAGIIAAGRYTKNITPEEIAYAAAAGFGLWFIHEGQGNLASFESGATAGEVNAKIASGVLQQLNIPIGLPIFSAVDFSATSADASIIAAYESGFDAGVAPYRRGEYADGAILDTLPPNVPTYVAGAGGWPGTQDYIRSGRAALIQHPTITFGGMEIDPVDIIDTSVVWWPKGEPQAADPGATATAMSQAAKHMPPLMTLQQWLVADGATIAVDGVWGPQTATALARAYGA